MEKAKHLAHNQFFPLKLRGEAETGVSAYGRTPQFCKDDYDVEWNGKFPIYPWLLGRYHYFGHTEWPQHL